MHSYQNNKPSRPTNNLVQCDLRDIVSKEVIECVMTVFESSETQFNQILDLGINAQEVQLKENIPQVGAGASWCNRRR